VRRRDAFRGAPVSGIAAAGVILGHWLTYLIAVPQSGSRVRLLVESGHGYWFLAVRLAVVLGAAGAGTLVLRLLRQPDTAGEEAARGHPLTRLVLELAGLQAVAFTAMEMLERVASHAPMASLFGHGVYLLGLAVQCLVAFVAAVVLLLLAGTAARIARALRRSPRGTAAVPAPWDSLFRPAPRFLSGAGGLRGPPLLGRTGDI
jgi:hypothetical protein